MYRSTARRKSFTSSTPTVISRPHPTLTPRHVAISGSERALTRCWQVLGLRNRAAAMAEVEACAKRYSLQTPA
jgi:hypothetical protein